MVVQAVKAALVVKQAPVSCSTSPAQPNQGQMLLANLSSKAVFGGVPSIQATAFGAVFAGSSASTGTSASQSKPAIVLPTCVASTSRITLSALMRNSIVICSGGTCSW